MYIVYCNLYLPELKAVFTAAVVLYLLEWNDSIVNSCFLVADTPLSHYVWADSEESV